MRSALLLLLAGFFRLGALFAAPAPSVPATMAVAGLQLTLDEDARRLIQLRADGLMRHEPAFRARVELADASFPIIDQMFRQAGVPADFRYLALQESALLGDAESRHGAVGYWQLKAETATELGLRVDGTVDERRHLSASTAAAARYLLRSQASTQNWLLALLSSQTGLGGVRSYQQPTDAGAAGMDITADTHPYLLMFLAHKLVFEPACGQSPAPPLLLREFAAQPGLTLDQQATALNVDPAVLRHHNRWLRRPEQPLPAEGGPYTLLVPVAGAAPAPSLSSNRPANANTSAAAPFPEPVAAAPGAPTGTAPVRINDLDALIALPGETAADLARRGGVRLGQLLRDNDLGALDALVPGRAYYLERKREEAATDYHVLAPGEDLAAVSQRHGIQRHAIRRNNHLTNNEDLRPGRVLWLRHIRPREVAIEYRDPAEAARLERRTAVRSQPAPAASPASVTVSKPRTPAATPAPAPAATATVADQPASSVASAPAVVMQPVPAPPVAAAPTAAPTADATAAVPPAAATMQLPAEPATTAAAAVSAAAVAPVPATGLYLVQARETVYGLARRYGLRPADLLTWNKLPAGTGLRLGQTLRLTAPDVTTEAAAAAPPTTHTVLPGETLFSIGRRYGRTAAALQQLNGKTSAKVKVGEVLRLSAP